MGACDSEGGEEASGDAWLIAVGIAISVFASVASNLGVNIQKYSFIQEAKKPPEKRRSYVKQFRWWFGLVLVISGAIGDFVAFAFAPASVVTPVGALNLVSNVAFAHLWLGESVSCRDYIGTALIVIGATVAVAFGDHSTKCFELDELKELWEQTSVFVYLGVVVALLVTMYLTVRAAEKELTKAADAESTPSTPVLVSDVDPPPSYQKFMRWHPLCYAGLAGTLGAQTVLFAKSTAELLKLTFSGDNQMDQVLTYVILLCMFATIFSQQHWLATGLQYFDALYIVPVFQAFFIGVSVIAGGVYFQEFNSFDTMQWILFPSGVMLCLFGVFLLSDRDMSRGKDDSSTDSESPAAPIVPVPPKARRRGSVLSDRRLSTVSTRVPKGRRPSLIELLMPSRALDGEAPPQPRGRSATMADAVPRGGRRASFLRTNWQQTARVNRTESLLPMPKLSRRRAATDSYAADQPADTAVVPPVPSAAAPPPTPQGSRRRSVLEMLGTGFVEMLGAGVSRAMLVPTIAEAEVAEEAEGVGEQGAEAKQSSARAPALPATIEEGDEDGEEKDSSESGDEGDVATPHQDAKAGPRSPDVDALVTSSFLSVALLDTPSSDAEATPHVHTPLARDSAPKEDDTPQAV